MIVLKRRPFPQRVRYSYRGYRALKIGRWDAFVMALQTSLVRKVPPRRLVQITSRSHAWRQFWCRWFRGHQIKASFDGDRREWSYHCTHCGPLKGPER